MKLEKNQRFISVKLGHDIIIRITRVDHNLNELGIKYYPKYGDKILEVWNLEHSIWSFERGEYKLLQSEMNRN